MPSSVVVDADEAPPRRGEVDAGGGGGGGSGSGDADGGEGGAEPERDDGGADDRGAGAPPEEDGAAAGAGGPGVAVPRLPPLLPPSPPPLSPPPPPPPATKSDRAKKKPPSDSDGDPDGALFSATKPKRRGRPKKAAEGEDGQMQAGAGAGAGAGVDDRRGSLSTDPQTNAAMLQSLHQYNAALVATIRARDNFNAAVAQARAAAASSRPDDKAGGGGRKPAAEKRGGKKGGGRAKEPESAKRRKGGAKEKGEGTAEKPDVRGPAEGDADEAERATLTVQQRQQQAAAMQTASWHQRWQMLPPQTIAEMQARMRSLSQIQMNLLQSGGQGLAGAAPMPEQERGVDEAARGKAKGATGEGATTSLVAPSSSLGARCTVVLTLPPKAERRPSLLGLVLRDDRELGMPELKRISKDSAVKDQIPAGFRRNCRVGGLRLEGAAGWVRPTRAKECVEAIERARGAGGSGSKKEKRKSVRLEVLLIAVAPKAKAKGKRKAKSSPEASSATNPPSKRRKKEAGKGKAGGEDATDDSAKPPTKRRATKARKEAPSKEKRASQSGSGAQKVPPRKKAKRATPTWHDSYEAVKRFHAHCGALPAPGTALRDWIERQRGAVLMKPDAAKLKKVGVVVDGAAALEAWRAKREEVEAYRLRHQTLPSSQGDKNSRELHEWIERQKEAMESEVLHKRYARPLRKLGIFPNGDPGPTGEEEVAPKRPRERDPASFWKVFGFDRGDDVVAKLRERIDALKKANESVNGWKSLVPNDDDKLEHYTHHDIMAVRQKAQTLARAYLMMTKGSTSPSSRGWTAVSDACAQELRELGINGSDKGESIRKWNAQFRTSGRFSHPKRLVAPKEKPHLSVKIFDYFPRAKEMFVAIANENKRRLTGGFMRAALATTILPRLERESLATGCLDDGSPGQVVLAKLIARPPSIVLITRWMHELGIEWDIQASKRGRGGESQLSRRLKEAWTEGKFANRRPKGQGGNKGEGSAAEGNGDNSTEAWGF